METHEKIHNALDALYRAGKPEVTATEVANAVWPQTRAEDRNPAAPAAGRMMRALGVATQEKKTWRILPERLVLQPDLPGTEKCYGKRHK